ncbi:hypothetical protein [Xanthovirga aplysinae]|uniref:hypothetical protein n=1 Tax=Xanthovirga aplysinae TaxID=2529853 RepID=UPI0012BC8949|nr:hypothetical protein [Xanthovirga aplysinae]MTI30964.1 hypothetical protein [Xanthovirga aplysinae]
MKNLAILFFTFLLLFSCNSKKPNSSTLEDKVSIQQKSPYTGKRFHFSYNATRMREEGHLKGFQKDRYLFSAKAYQQLRVQLESFEKDAIMDVYRIEGESRKSLPLYPKRKWKGKLKESGEYMVEVFLKNPKAKRALEADYVLIVELR